MLQEELALNILLLLKSKPAADSSDSREMRVPSQLTELESPLCQLRQRNCARPSANHKKQC